MSCNIKLIGCCEFIKIGDVVDCLIFVKIVKGVKI